MTKTKRKPTTASKPKSAGPVIRIAVLVNPKTKRTVYERVTKDGRLSKRAAAKLGVKRVKEFVTVRAASWKAATVQVRARAKAPTRRAA